MMSQYQDKIIIGSDHAGYGMKEFIKSELENMGIVYKDIGTDSTDSVDYPIYVGRVAKAVSSGEFSRGIAVCRTGIGSSITANRFKGVRAALCITVEMARLSRLHNNANVLVIGGKITGEDTVSNILKVWFNTIYEEGRHDKRIKLIDEVDTIENL